VLDWTDALLDSAAAPSNTLVLGTAALALAAIVVLWPLTRHVITLTHEGGHAAVALVTGRRIAGIHLHSDSSGAVYSSGSRPTLILVLLAGYTAPPGVALAMTLLLAQGRVVIVLLAATALVLLMIIAIRNAFGVLSVLLTGGALLAVVWYADLAGQRLVAYTLTWFLLLGGLRDTVELFRIRRFHRQTDADLLAGSTHVPGVLWTTLFLAVSVGAVYLAARLLLP
jgi:hypothetical protein